MPADTTRRFEPMLLLVVGLPAAAVVAGILTVVIAVRSGGSHAVPDPVRRIAQVQQADVAADGAAARLALSGRMRLDPGSGAIEVMVAGAASLDRLRLDLVHPIDGDRDRTVTLVRAGDRFVGRIDAGGPARWHLVLAPLSGDWRLVGVLVRGADSAALAPALELARR